MLANAPDIRAPRLEPIGAHGSAAGISSRSHTNLLRHPGAPRYRNRPTEWSHRSACGNEGRRWRSGSGTSASGAIPGRPWDRPPASAGGAEALRGIHYDASGPVPVARLARLARHYVNMDQFNGGGSSADIPPRETQCADVASRRKRFRLQVLRYSLKMFLYAPGGKPHE